MKTSFRSRLLLVIGASIGCRSTTAQPDPSGSAPSSTSSAVGAVARPPGSFLPLVEPVPVRSPSCERSQCVTEAAQIPSPHFPAPFERCLPLLDTGDPLQERSFSPRLTAERRATEPSACCYRIWVACPGKGGGRPLLCGGGQAWARLRPGGAWG